jgi:hypothetical protein
MPDEISGFLSHHGFLIGAIIFWATLCLLGRQIVKSIEQLRSSVLEAKTVLRSIHRVLEPDNNEMSLHFLVSSMHGEVWKISDKLVNYPQYDKWALEWEKEVQEKEEKDGG